MADLTDLQAAQTIKIAGSDSTGVEDNFVNADSNGNLNVINPSDGPVTPGTVATKSQLGGMQYNTAAPAPTNGQQLALQSTNDGKLKVDASLTSGQLVPTITNKLRIRSNIGNISLPATNAFVTLYTRSGTGLFFGFQADFNSANVNVRFTIDSGAIFTLKIADIKAFQFNDTTAGRVQMGGFLTTIGNTLDFSSRFAIPYSTSVLIEAAATDSSAHNNTQYIVIQTEDT